MKPPFSTLPEPPYYAVIFSSQRTADEADYDKTAARMVELAERQAGFLGAESARDAVGFGITVSYWQSPEAIAAWKADVEHQLAQERGRRDWYAAFATRVARVERNHEWSAPQG